MAAAVTSTAPFTVTLDRLGIFRRHDSSVVYLAPDENSEGPLKALQAAIAGSGSVMDNYDDLGLYEGGFTPHLTIGRFKSHVDAETAVQVLSSLLKEGGFSWRVEELHMIARHDKPEAQFVCDTVVGLGSGEGGVRHLEDEEREYDEMPPPAQRHHQDKRKKTNKSGFDALSGEQRRKGTRHRSNFDKGDYGGRPDSIS